MEKSGWQLASAARRRRRTRLQPCKRCAASTPKRKKACRSLLRGGGRHLHIELLTQCNEAWVVHVRQEERCHRHLGEAGVVLGIGCVEPLKHLVRILASRIEHRDLECSTSRISGNEIVEGSIRRSS